MFEATLKTMRGNLMVKCSAETVRDLWEAVSALEVFDAEQACGLCGSPDIVYQTRVTASSDRYYELACRACSAQFSFGQHKGAAGTLFPKRKEGANGWRKWQQIPEGQPAEGPDKNQFRRAQ